MKAIIKNIIKTIITLGLTVLAIYWGPLGLLLAIPVMKIWNIE